MRTHRPSRLSTRPSVSVVVPCYNYGHFLPDAVASAFAGNDDVDVDVIVVDDCSTDASVTVARSLASRSERVRLIEHASNRGHIATYNDGLADVTGDYVVLLSADDLLTPGSLSRSVALMERHPEVGLVYGYPVSFTGEPPTSPDLAVRSWTTWTGEEWLRRVCARGRNPIINPEAVLRRDLMDELGGYEPDHPHAGDMKLWMRAAARADVGRVNGAVQALYRDHGANMHTTTFGGVLTDLRETRRVFDTFFREGEVPPRLAAELEPAARRALAREALLAAEVAQVGTEPDAGAADLVGLATELWPPITTSRRMGAYTRRAVRGPAPGEARLVRRASALRWQVRWRRWRRFGT